MGNFQIDPSLFEYSEREWKRTKDPQTLMLESDKVLGHCISKKFITSEEYEALKIRANNRQFLANILAVIG